MSDPRAWMISYLAARGDVPWRWADDGNVITWADGTTICFREEIIYILEWLLPHGWPSFSALVWMLAACRGKQPPALDPPMLMLMPRQSEEQAKRLGAGGRSEVGEMRNYLRQMYHEVERGLAEVARLPQELRGSLKAKAVLAEIVFGGKAGPGALRALLEDALQILRSGELTDAALNAVSAPPPGGVREWDDLRGGLARIEPDTLAVRLRTGLDTLPQAAKIPLPPAARMRQLLQELRADPEHAGLARLTRDFMAALQLPRKLAENDDLPIGGLSDIANRGNLDRLLLSELAHDDLTLAVRIALGEALYLRREPPARQPPVTVAVLLDSGVRLWGVPRVLATGIAMALIAKSAPHESVAVHRASGAGLAPVNLLEKDGLITHLGALEANAHPGEALPAFRESLHGPEHAEAVIITHRDAAEDAGFLRSLELTKFDSLYLALVDREGGFELRRYPHSGQALCQAQVSVEDLLPVPPKISRPRQPLVDPSAKADLPLIFSVSPFPLLLTVIAPVQHAIPQGFCITRDRRLLEWQPVAHGPRYGARTIAHGLPPGRTILLTCRPDKSIAIVKVHRGRNVSCRIYSPDGALQHSLDLRVTEHILWAAIQGNALLVASRSEVRAVNLVDGQELARLPAPPALPTWTSEMYFQTGGQWNTFIWDGRTLKASPVSLGNSIVAEGVYHVFHREGFLGPWVVTRLGNIYSPEGTQVMQVGNFRSMRQIRFGSHRLLMDRDPSSATYIVDLAFKSVAQMTASNRKTLDADLALPTPRTIHWRFNRIAILNNQVIVLHAPASGWWRVMLEEKYEASDSSRAVSSRLFLCSIRELPSEEEIVDFWRLKTLSPLGVAWSVARWPDGRSAWLDRQGMLHLHSVRPGAPDVTLVLSGGSINVWTSEGRYSGSMFFCNEHPRISATEIWPAIGKFCQPLP